MKLEWDGVTAAKRHRGISAALYRAPALVALCLGVLPLFTSGCAAAPRKAAGEGCRRIEQTVNVNGRQETMKTIACRRPEGKAWDSP